MKTNICSKCHKRKKIELFTKETNICSKCTKEYKKIYNKQNKEHLNAKCLDRYYKNKKEENLKRQLYYYNNIEKEKLKRQLRYYKKEVLNEKESKKRT